MLLQGTATRSAEQIALEIESVVAALTVLAATTAFGVSAEVMREDFAVGLGLVADVVLYPTFPAEACMTGRRASKFILIPPANAG